MQTSLLPLPMCWMQYFGSGLLSSTTITFSSTAVFCCRLFHLLTLFVLCRHLPLHVGLPLASFALSLPLSFIASCLNPSPFLLFTLCMVSSLSPAIQTIHVVLYVLPCVKNSVLLSRFDVELILIILIYLYLWNLFDEHAYPTLHWRGLKMPLCFAAGDGLCICLPWCCVRVIAIGIHRCLSNHRDLLITIYFLCAWSCFFLATSLRGFLVSKIGPVNFLFRPIYFLSRESPMAVAGCSSNFFASVDSVSSFVFIKLTSKMIRTNIITHHAY